MTRAIIITARRPPEVAREVASLVALGCEAFVLRPVAQGGMLDLERLGAARYAAGVHSRVELEAEAPEASARSR